MADLRDCPTGYADGCACDTCAFFAVEDAYSAWLKLDTEATAQRDASGVPAHVAAGWGDGEMAGA